MREYTVEKLAKCRELYTFKEKNYKGEAIEVELVYCSPEFNTSTSFPKKWKEQGYTDKVLESYIIANVYVTDENGNSSEKYNPQITSDFRLNYEWIVEVTEENKKRIIHEIERRAFEREF